MKDRGTNDFVTSIIESIEHAPRHLRALTRSWQGILILAIVASQLVLPLHYYLARKDRHDERFAWRMFSPMRMGRCAPKFLQDDVPLPLDKHFHEAWLEVAQRGRFTVVEAMAERLCAKFPRASIRVTLECKYIDRPDETFGGFDMCKVPLL